MKQKIIVTCPYLGLANDPTANFGEPSDAQQCYSPQDPGKVELEFQQAVCLTSGYCDCKRFTQNNANRALIPVSTIPVQSAVTIIPQRSSPPSRFSLANYLPHPESPRFIEIGLWGIVAILALVTLYFAQPLIFKLIQPVLFQRQSVAVVAPLSTPTSQPTSTPTLLPTETPTAAPSAQATSAPLMIPTPPANGTVLTLSANPALTGWTVSSEPAPRWGDRLLLAGSLKKETYSSILHFDLGNLPPGSEIKYAALELAGRDGSQLGTAGVWQLELIDGSNAKNLADQSSDVVASITPVAVVGNSLSTSDLGAGLTNDFVMSQEDLALIEKQIGYGSLTFRLRTTDASADHLFAWNGASATGGGLDTPTLYLVAIPKPFIIITNTPYPTNVFTAAAQVLKSTAEARLHGTPTPFPPGVATATSAPGTIFVPPPPTPVNAATRQAESDYATAVAITTGTFTPTPKNIVIAYPTATPVLIDINQIAPPTAAKPTGNLNYLATPIPSYLIGKILVQSNRLGQPYANLPLVLDQTGKLTAVLSSRAYYDAAAARESFAPDRQRRAVVAADASGRLQIWILDLQSNAMTQMTNVSRGIAYDPVWSPDGTRIAYVSTQTGIAEIYVYDIGSMTNKQITFTSSSDFFNQRPSWSPDSQTLVFKSNRDDVTHFQIYLIQADGTGLRNISLNQFDETDPIWVKP